MYKLTAENEYGDAIELTHNPAYDIDSTDGFDPPDAVINTTSGAGDDGSVFNSSRLENRTVTLTILINSPALENRLALYKYFKSKRYVKLTYETEARSVYCEGYVQNITVDMFAKKEVAQITVLCPNPFLMATENDVNEFSYVEDLFEFPFAIEEAGEPMSELHMVQEEIVTNSGDLPTGAVITLHCIGAVTNPVVTYADTGEKIEIYRSFASGALITIDTRRKHKSVMLEYNNTVTNLIGYLTSDSTFFELRAGESAVVVDATSGAANIETRVVVEGHFEGV